MADITGPNAAAPAAAPAEAAPHPVVVQLTGVRKAYNAGLPIETEVLHGIDLTVRHGEFCAVVGPSGSGKSTLLNIVGLLDRPTSGTVEVCGEQTTRLDDRALTRLRGHSIGFVFQYHHLITAFTALENVMMPMLGAEEFANEAMRARAAKLIDSVGLTAWKDNLAGNLSGGQQQRVAIARGLAMEPAPLALRNAGSVNLSMPAYRNVAPKNSRTGSTARRRRWSSAPGPTARSRILADAERRAGADGAGADGAGADGARAVRGRTSADRRLDGGTRSLRPPVSCTCVVWGPRVRVRGPRVTGSLCACHAPWPSVPP